MISDVRVIALGDQTSDSRQNLRNNAILFNQRLIELKVEERLALAQFIATRCFLVVVSTPDLDSALEVAPEAALSNIDAEAGLLAAMSRRLKQFWPELARTVTADVSEPSSNRTKRKKKEVRVETLEAKSSYVGPSDEAIKGEEPDE